MWQGNQVPWTFHCSTVCLPTNSSQQQSHCLAQRPRSEGPNFIPSSFSCVSVFSWCRCRRSRPFWCWSSSGTAGAWPLEGQIWAPTAVSGISRCTTTACICHMSPAVCNTARMALGTGASTCTGGFAGRSSTTSRACSISSPSKASSHASPGSLLLSEPLLTLLSAAAGWYGVSGVLPPVRLRPAVVPDHEGR